jgi:hypothetical protein
MVSTPDRIVAGIDRQIMRVGPQGQPAGHGTATKIALLKGRFIVACIGLESLQGIRPTGETFMAYDFTNWIKTIETQITSETTTSALSEIVGKEGRKVLTDTLPVTNWMKTGLLKETDFTRGTIIQFNVVGFDGGVNTLVQIRYRLDWDYDSVIGPLLDAHPLSKAFNSGVYCDGVSFAISEYQNAKSYAYKRMNVLAPVAFSKLMTNRNVDQNESIRAARALVAIETEVEPNAVGAGAIIIVLPRDGKGLITEYPDSLSPSSGNKHPKRH